MEMTLIEWSVSMDQHAVAFHSVAPFWWHPFFGFLTSILPPADDERSGRIAVQIVFPTLVSDEIRSTDERHHCLRFHGRLEVRHPLLALEGERIIGLPIRIAAVELGRLMSAGRRPRRRKHNWAACRNVRFWYAAGLMPPMGAS